MVNIMSAEKIKTTDKTKASNKKTPARDPFGTRIGSQAATINAALGKKPKAEADIVKESALPQARVRAHLRWLVLKGHCEKVANGYQVKG
jgi:predicted Rossmann fold nucleotide-binding protein DprA/Smf involved in DNA uptake